MHLCFTVWLEYSAICWTPETNDARSIFSVTLYINICPTRSLIKVYLNLYLQVWQKVSAFGRFDRARESTGVLALQEFSTIFSHELLITKITAGSMLGTRFSSPTSARCWTVGISRRLSCSFDHKITLQGEIVYWIKMGILERCFFNRQERGNKISETGLEPMIFRTLLGRSDYWASGSLVMDLNYASC